jgi:integral membrane protein
VSTPSAPRSDTAGSAGATPPPPEVVASMRRYRVGAWVVGVGLLVLVLVGMPLKYLAGDPTVVAIVGPLHGFLYMGYLLLTADLAYRARWPVSRAVLVALAGTIPFVSFVAERVVTRPLRDARAGATPSAPPAR